MYVEIDTRTRGSAGATERIGKAEGGEGHETRTAGSASHGHDDASYVVQVGWKRSIPSTAWNHEASEVAMTFAAVT